MVGGTRKYNFAKQLEVVQNFPTSFSEIGNHSVQCSFNRVKIEFIYIYDFVYTNGKKFGHLSFI